MPNGKKNESLHRDLDRVFINNILNRYKTWFVIISIYCYYYDDDVIVNKCFVKITKVDFDDSLWKSQPIMLVRCRLRGKAKPCARVYMYKSANIVKI